MHLRTVFYLLIVAVACSLVALPVMAAEDDSTEKPSEAKKEASPEKEAEPEEIGADDVLAMPVQKPHWFNFFWRGGLGLEETSVGIDYADESESFTAKGSGLSDSHLFMGWFYPTADRAFLLNIGLGGGSGNGELDSSNEKSSFLNKKEYWYWHWMVPVGVGYRWFLGSDDSVALSLYGEGHWSYNALFFEGAEDGIELNGGGAGVVVGAHYRYDRGFLWGGLFEVRYNAAAVQDAEILGKSVDVDFSGYAFYLTMILGYEPR